MGREALCKSKEQSTPQNLKNICHSTARFLVQKQGFWWSIWPLNVLQAGTSDDFFLLAKFRIPFVETVVIKWAPLHAHPHISYCTALSYKAFPWYFCQCKYWFMSPVIPFRFNRLDALRIMWPQVVLLYLVLQYFITQLEKTIFGNYLVTTHVVSDLAAPFRVPWWVHKLGSLAQGCKAKH